MPCTLTLPQFEAWCKETGYLEQRGQSPESATVERIDHNEGYHIWNITVLSHAENSANGHTSPAGDTAQNEQHEYEDRGCEHDHAPDLLPEGHPDCPF